MWWQIFCNLFYYSVSVDVSEILEEAPHHPFGSYLSFEISFKWGFFLIRWWFSNFQHTWKAFVPNLSNFEPHFLWDKKWNVANIGEGLPTAPGNFFHMEPVLQSCFKNNLSIRIKVARSLRLFVIYYLLNFNNFFTTVDGSINNFVRLNTWVHFCCKKLYRYLYYKLFLMYVLTTHNNSIFLNS